MKLVNNQFLVFNVSFVTRIFVDLADIIVSSKTAKYSFTIQMIFLFCYLLWNLTPVLYMLAIHTRTFRREVIQQKDMEQLMQMDTMPSNVNDQQAVVKLEVLSSRDHVYMSTEINNNEIEMLVDQSLTYEYAENEASTSDLTGDKTTAHASRSPIPSAIRHAQQNTATNDTSMRSVDQIEELRDLMHLGVNVNLQHTLYHSNKHYFRSRSNSAKIS